MKPLISDPTDHSPKIVLDPDQDRFEISGISRPEDVREFYYPVLDWIKEFCSNAVEKKTYRYDETHPVVFKILLTYFNSSSAKFLYDILEAFNHLSKKGVAVRIEWFYDKEDTDMLEAGQEMAEMVEMPFEFVVRNP